VARVGNEIEAGADGASFLPVTTNQGQTSYSPRSRNNSTASVSSRLQVHLSFLNPLLSVRISTYPHSTRTIKIAGGRQSGAGEHPPMLCCDIGVKCHSMEKFWITLDLLWENKPGAFILLVIGFFVFVFLVADASRHYGHLPKD
jgi:hypothetical protein